MNSFCRTSLVVALVTLIFHFFNSMTSVQSCNEVVCASIVSKCMITQSCKCDLSKNCSCCKDCFHCLSNLYSECCSCVDMCPKPNYTPEALSRRSHVEDLSAPFPDLFIALTSAPDLEKRWTSFMYPIDFDLTMFKATNQKEFKSYRTQNVEQEVDLPRKDMVTLNCSVAYLSQCMSWNKCKQSCQSMGAASYRWFHDGCCECIGNTCINYGINDSRCLRCPSNKEDGDEDVDLSLPNDNSQLDYGEDDSDTITNEEVA